MAEHVPLPVADDGAQGMELQQKHAARTYAGRTRSASARDWSALCMRPKQSRTTSAGPVSTAVSPRCTNSPNHEPP